MDKRVSFDVKEQVNQVGRSAPAPRMRFASRGPRRDTSLIGKTVRITQGPMKSYLGIVKDATDSTVRVELFAQPKVDKYFKLF